MNTREVASEYRLASWTQAVQERVGRKESIKAFCERKGVSRNTYFYWQRKLRETACKQITTIEPISKQTKLLPTPVFAEVKIAEIEAPGERNEIDTASQIKVEIGGVKITTDSSYPTEKLAALCRELVQS